MKHESTALTEIVKSESQAPKVEVGAGGAPPKVALSRAKAPKVEVGTGGLPPRVALLRSRDG